MPARKTSTSKSRNTSDKNSTGKKVTRSSGKSKATTQSALKKNVASLNTKSGSSKTTSKTSKTKDRGVKHTRSKNIELFPHNSMPWRLEPRTSKFNLSWYMCFDHAVDQIERQNLKPKDYKLMCYTSVPLTDPLTGPTRIQRYVKS